MEWKNRDELEEEKKKLKHQIYYSGAYRWNIKGEDEKRNYTFQKRQ